MKTEPTRIGLISAVVEEGPSIIGGLKPASKKGGPPPPVYAGVTGGSNIVYAVSGVGKVNAAHTTSVLVREHCVSLVVNFGVGGAYPSSGLKIGDIAVALKEVYADEGVITAEGFHSLEAMGMHLFLRGASRYYNDFPLDRKMAVVAEKAARSVAPARAGVFLTVSTCSGTRERAAFLQDRFGGMCENMEGAAVAHICRLHGVPCVEIRGISNIVEERDKRKWDIGLAAGNCQKALREFLRMLNEAKS